MKFRADEISSVIQREIEQFSPEVTRSEVGSVLEVGDGIARVYGLSGLMAGEMVTFENGVKGIALNLEESSVGVMVLGDYTQIEEGDSVSATGALLRVPVGEGMIGRVVNPLGEPIDDQGPITGHETWPLESIAPGIAERQPVDEPMQTGIKSIDSMTPIGRGQRELIIGDRKTGKTAIAIDTILNQKGTGVICVYVAIAQKESSPLMPAARWPSFSCTAKASRRSSSTMTYRSRRPPTGKCRCSCADRPGAKPFLAISSTRTQGSLSDRPSSPITTSFFPNRRPLKTSRPRWASTKRSTSGFPALKKPITR
jgi:hypothetical protein